jgi:DNA-binding CsgD family transcriptional regulator
LGKVENNREWLSGVGNSWVKLPPYSRRTHARTRGIAGTTPAWLTPSPMPRPGKRDNATSWGKRIRAKELEASRPSPVVTRFVCPLCTGPHSKLDCPDLPPAERMELLSREAPTSAIAVRRKQVAKLREEGLSIRKIATKIGCSAFTVSTDIHQMANRHQRIAAKT